MPRKKTSKKSPKKKSKSKETKTVESDTLAPEEAKITPSDVLEEQKFQDIQMEQQEQIGSSNELKNQLEKVQKDYNTALNEIKRRDDLINQLSSRIKQYEVLADEIQKERNVDDLLEIWQQATYSMSQFIADKAGFTQAEVLKRFGIE